MKNALIVLVSGFVGYVLSDYSSYRFAKHHNVPKYGGFWEHKV